VWACDVPESLNFTLIDIAKYKELLFRAIYELLQPFGVSGNVLRDWMFSGASYLIPSGILHSKLEMPLFADLNKVRVDII
jgi:hypothetical protein